MCRQWDLSRCWFYIQMKWVIYCERDCSSFYSWKPWVSHSIHWIIYISHICTNKPWIIVCSTNMNHLINASWMIDAFFLIFRLLNVDSSILNTISNPVVLSFSIQYVDFQDIPSVLKGICQSESMSLKHWQLWRSETAYLHHSVQQQPSRLCEQCFISFQLPMQKRNSSLDRPLKTLVISAGCWDKVNGLSVLLYVRIKFSRAPQSTANES